MKEYTEILVLSIEGYDIKTRIRKTLFQRTFKIPEQFGIEDVSFYRSYKEMHDTTPISELEEIVNKDCPEYCTHKNGHKCLYAPVSCREDGCPTCIYNQQREITDNFIQSELWKSDTQ